jgi:tetratricopeptide (TPR) repeat protein
MPQHTLRTFLQEIDDLINTDRAESAAVQCRQVLLNFPKNLAAYRLMGRANLDQGKYADAADAFLRLLSSLPGDFTAHLALSLIREQQGALEPAIWHMERAREARPASQAVVNELTRLFESRDGGATQPVGLTRAALGRLFLQGKCFPQAVAELQAAWDDNPERLDIHLLLAEAYLLAGQDGPAIQVCQDILQKLPYSLQANRILFQNTTDLNQALPYRQRLQELDPYWGYVTSEVPDPESVDDNLVQFTV